LRLARWLKIARYSQALDTLGRVLRSRKAELGITAFLGLLLLLFASSLMYFVEHEAQPRVFSSIPSAMWWGVVTLTTVGYGDIYPVTSLGKFIGGAIEILGIGLFALPAGIVASGFAEELQRRKQERGHQCPHCGKEFVE
jgi:voltage-gated potassium channel